MLVYTKNPIALNHEATTVVLSIESVFGSLHSTMWLLFRNAMVYEKLRDSVLGTIGHGTPFFEQLNEFSYLRNVLHGCICNSSL
jgi:hypothetical protein